jgi:hypothetical protein
VSQKKPYTIFYEDKNKKIYKVEKYSEKDVLLNYFIYEYDEDGIKIGVKAFDGKHNLIN